MKRTCSTCNAFFHDKRMSGAVNGQCRFNPKTHEGFPPVRSDEWCKKHEPSKDTKPGFW